MPDKELKLSDLEIMQDGRFQTANIRLNGKEILALEVHLYLRAGDVPVVEITIPIKSIKVKCKAKVEIKEERERCLT